MVKKFDAFFLDEQVNWLNEFLGNFLRARTGTKKALQDYFDNCQADNDGIKKFNLLRWGGGIVSPTLEIAQVKGEFKFATTRYGVLSPLNKGDCNKPEVKNVIMNFFINPGKHFPEQAC